MEKRIPVLLDGDPGHDDAMAWVLAKACPFIEIKGITTVAGNQTIEKTTYNAMRVCTLLGIDAPIAKGRSMPLLCAPRTAGNIHGQSGLDGPSLPEPCMELSALSPVELMAKVLRESDEPVAIIPTGPMTNVAALLLAHPELKHKIRVISFMGGGIQSGNWSAAAEFNILVDPEAADTVLRSGIPLYMAGLDITERALIFPNDFEKIRSVGNEVARVVADWLEFFYKFHREIGYEGAPVHDPCAVVALIKPELITYEDMYVEVETKGQYCRGMTVGDRKGVLGKKPNVHVGMKINRDGFADLLLEAVKTFDSEGK